MSDVAIQLKLAQTRSKEKFTKAQKTTIKVAVISKTKASARKESLRNRMRESKAIYAARHNKNTTFDIPNKVIDNERFTGEGVLLLGGFFGVSITFLPAKRK